MKRDRASISELRESLAAYLADIAETPTLDREQEIILSKEIRSADHELRDAVLCVPWAANEVVRIWRDLQTQGRVTGKMSESFGSGGVDGKALGPAARRPRRVRGSVRCCAARAREPG
jgi:hypothetical protein